MSISHARSVVVRNRAAANEDEIKKLEEIITQKNGEIERLKKKLKDRDDEPVDDESNAAVARSNRRLARRAAALGLDVNELKREVNGGRSSRSRATGGIGSLPRRVLEQAGIIGSSNRAVERKNGGLYLEVVPTAEAKARHEELATQRARLEGAR